MKQFNMMKIKRFTALTTTLLYFQLGQAMLNNDSISDNAFNRKANFSRTFKNGENLIKKTETKKNNIIKNLHKKTENDILISFEDFSNHLAAGKNRISTRFNNPYTMNIGEIDSGIKETWELSNPGELNTQSIVINQLQAEGTAIYNSFGAGTHVMNIENTDIYELYDLQDDLDLFFLGASEVEDGELIEYEHYQSLSPVPLETNLIFSSEVVFEQEDEPDFTYSYTDIYNIVGQGTLKIYDESDVDALKMMYTEEYREFENGLETYYEERYQVVFYSKEGHYITADIENPELEGEVVLENLTYQKLEGKSEVLNSNFVHLVNVKTFPNPVTSGELFTIQSTEELTNGVVTLFNIQGQKIKTISLINSAEINQYQAKLPSDLKSGLCFYQVTNKKGVILTKGKIQIQ